MTDSDTRPDDEHHVIEVPATAIPVAEFEGTYITDMEAILPRMVIEMPEGYTRDTHLRLNVEVRVKSVRLEENRRGDLVRQHVLGIEDVQLVSAFRPEEARDAGVGGSAGAADPEEAKGLPVQFGRTSDTWGAAANG